MYSCLKHGHVLRSRVNYLRLFVWLNMSVVGALSDIVERVREGESEAAGRAGG